MKKQCQPSAVSFRRAFGAACWRLVADSSEGGDMTETEQMADSAAKATEALKQLQQMLLHLALELVEGLGEAVPDAPLNQRVAMLKALIDGVLKLEARMPKEETEERVYRLEYRYPDGSIHSSPPWAGDDPEEDEAVHGSRVRSSLREDGVGEITRS